MVGLPKSIIKKYGVTKKAWQVYRSRHRSKSSSLKSYTHRAMKRAARHSQSRSVRNLARRRFSRRHRRMSRGGLLKAAETISKAGSLAAPGIRAFAESSGAPPIEKVKQLAYRYSGVKGDGSFDSHALVEAATPVIAVYLGWKIFHKANGWIRRV